MIKIFCDTEIDSQSHEKCGNEVDPQIKVGGFNYTLLAFLGLDLTCRIHPRLAKHICKSCLIKALKGE